MEKKIRVGSIVKLKDTAHVLGNKPGTKGICYEEYQIGNHKGVSIIFPNGRYDGFDKEEQLMLLEWVSDNGPDYKFENVLKLSQDFEKVFEPYLKN